MVSGSSDPDSFLDNAAEWRSTFVLFLKVATWLILSSTFMSIFHCFLSWGGKKKIGWQVLFFFTPCQEQEEKEPVFAKSVCICILRRCLRVLSVVYTPVTGYLFLHTTNCVYVCVCVLAACQQRHNATRIKPIRANMVYTGRDIHNFRIDVYNSCLC